MCSCLPINCVEHGLSSRTSLSCLPWLPLGRVRIRIIRIVIPLDYSSIQFGNLQHSMNGFTTVIHTNSQFFTSLQVQLARWVENGNSLSDYLCVHGSFQRIPHLLQLDQLFSLQIQQVKVSTLNFMFVFQAEHNILMHPFHIMDVAAVFGGSRDLIKNTKFFQILISDREIPVKTTSFSRFPY